jgi:hypothetical protein
MPAMRTRGALSFPSSAILLSVFVSLAAATSIALAASPSAGVDDAARIAVTAVAGDVDVTMAGAAADVQPQSTVSLPARVVTGSDGMLGLTQAGTNITVAGDSDVEIPAEAVDGNLIARLVQHRGNVFYDVAHRDAGKLRVETPFLVAVIKGTQFNVAVQNDSTTISLFEGRLEIRTPDGGDVIQLNAGEIAIRSRTDDTIRVLGMNEERVEAPRAAGRIGNDAIAAAAADEATVTTIVADGIARASEGATADNSPAAVSAQASSGAVDLGNASLGERATMQIASGLDLAGDKPIGVDTQASVDLGLASTALDLSAGAGGLDAGLNANLNLGAATVAVGVDAGIDLGAGAVDLGVSAGVGVGGITADVGLGTSLDLGGGNVSLALDTDLSVGGLVAADVGLDTALELGGGSVDLGVGAGIGLGGITADLGVDAGVDLGGGSIDLGLDTGVDLGGVAGIDLGVGAGVDLGGGTVDVGLDTGIDLGGAVVDVGLDTGVDLAGGSVDVGLDVGGLSVDIGLDTGAGLDLGIDLGAADDVVTPVVAPIVPQVIAPILAPVLGGGGGGGLLGGLLGRRP